MAWRLCCGSIGTRPIPKAFRPGSIKRRKTRCHRAPTRCSLGVWSGISARPAPRSRRPCWVFVALVAPVVGRLGTRYGVRPIAVPGSFCWGAGVLMYALFVTETPNYWGLWLPASCLVAIGVATTFPIVSAAAVSEVPPAEFAVGGSLNQMGRQVGATIGVAALITVVGQSGDLDSFHKAWYISAATGPVAAIAIYLIGKTNSPQQRR